MNCLLTGGTGILGSHIIFEWLKKAIVEKTVKHLYVVIRDTQKQSAKERLTAVLQSASAPAYIKEYSLTQCLDKITIISSDLSSVSKELLSRFDFDTVIHCAGSTNLTNSEGVKEQVHHQNYLVTKHIIEQLPERVTRFLYISTAFSFGIQKEKVQDNIAKHTVGTFRNPYEASKYQSEHFVKKACEKQGISWQILRPSIICGRLLEPPFYETPKYDVFYSWAIFLDKYAKKSVDKFRIWIDKKSGLNIIPVDFAAKTILYALSNATIKELNIINPKQILHKNYVGQVLESFKIKNYEYLEEKPKNLNQFETLYYKTIGALFEKYVSIPDLQFDTELITKIMKDLQIDINLGVHDNFMDLIEYAVAKNFKKSY